MKILLTLVTGILLAVGARAESPEAVARTFFDAYVKLRVSGLPGEEQMKTFSPLLTPELAGLIAAARAEQEEFRKKNPDEKPPWIEGALFSSLFEGVSAYRLGEPVVGDDRASIPVYWEYTGDGQTSRWIDVVSLVRAGDTWKVADIFFCAPWDFRPGPTLRALLSGRE
jgi:hypothetical protein